MGETHCAHVSPGKGGLMNRVLGTEQTWVCVRRFVKTMAEEIKSKNIAAK